MPVNGSKIVAAELRDQFNGLKAIIDDLQNQLAQFAPLAPVLTRDNSGNWTLAFNVTGPDSWQIWSRNDSSPVWQQAGDCDYTDFPLQDGEMGATGVWWQVKVCGEDANTRPCTAFSNTISFDPVPV